MKKIILASKSPRRSQLLREAGFDFEVRIQDTDESYPDDLAVRDVPAFIAQKKAEALRHTLKADEVLIAADTVVIHAGEIYGKPANFEEAFETIRTLAGDMHEVVTGVFICSLDQQVTLSELSRVYFEEMTDQEIQYYINHWKPYDKAGAYGIQEWIGLCKIHHIEGTYANVMGLPVNRVYDALLSF